MRTVIDIGCARYGGDYSIERLLEMYEPDVLYGFDPAWTTTMIEVDPGVRVAIQNVAAWTYDGEVRFLLDGLNGQVGTADHWPFVPCIDLARFIEGLPPGEIILKLDAEGSEYDLLDHLIATGVDARLERVVVEWHVGNDMARARKESIERRLTCPVEVWGW